jgi:probable HAF family extracellular repeat protein
LALGINNSGQIVGTAYVPSNNFSHATLWNNSTAIDLTPNLSNFSYAYSINDTGAIVGAIGSRAAFWENGSFYYLDSLGGTYSEAYSNNNSGQAVGYSYTIGDAAIHATLWENDTAIDLGTLNGMNYSVASDINSVGQIVGWSSIESNNGYHATLWSNGVAIDLNDLIDNTDWFLKGAASINDKGQIVGNGIINGEQHAFLLTPDSATPVPEPSTIVLFGTGILVFEFLRRRVRA